MQFHADGARPLRHRFHFIPQLLTQHQQPPTRRLGQALGQLLQTQRLGVRIEDAKDDFEGRQTGAGLRIGLNWGEGEDARYRAIRARNEPGFAFKSLYIVFGLQGVLAWIIAMPLMPAMRPVRPINITAAMPISGRKRTTFSTCGIIVLYQPIMINPRTIRVPTTIRAGAVIGWSGTPPSSVTPPPTIRTTGSKNRARKTAPSPAPHKRQGTAAVAGAPPIFQNSSSGKNTL